MVLDLVPLWTVLLGAGRVLLRRLRWFRSRRRNSLWLCAWRHRACHRHELDRTDLGRQRDMAGVRRTRLARRFSARLRDHHSRGLFPNPDHAAGAGFPRRRLRVPVQAYRALRRFWDRAFCGGSAIATFAQGVVLGTFIQGFKVDGRQFTGTSFDWLDAVLRCSPGLR